jgi:excisionase family DNA binding protein
MQDEKLLTVEEAAEIMSVHSSTIRRFVKSGELAHVKIGTREYRIKRSELLRFIDQHESRGKEKEPPQQ